MSSNLRVDRILPSTGTEVGVGTATGSVALYGDVNIAGTLTYEDVTNIDSVGIITARNGIDVTGGNLLVGTTNAGGWLTKIQVPDNASYQSALNITNNVNADLQVEIKSSETRFGPSTNTPLIFKNGGGERLRITSDGKIGVNNTSPFSDLQVITAGQTEDGTFRIGGSQASLGLVLDYDQSGATVSRITANPTYTNTSSLLKICVDGDANPDQLVLKGDGKMGVGCTPETDFQVRNGNGGTIKIGGSGTNATGLEFQYNNSGTTTSVIKTNYRSTNANASLKIDTGTFIVATGTSGSEKVRISSGGLAINKNAAADTDIEIVQSADPTLRLYDTRNAAYKADFMMAGSAPLIRNNNTSASDRTLSIQK